MYKVVRFFEKINIQHGYKKILIFCGSLIFSGSLCSASHCVPKYYKPKLNYSKRFRPPWLHIPA